MYLYILTNNRTDKENINKKMGITAYSIHGNNYLTSADSGNLSQTPAG